MVHGGGTCMGSFGLPGKGGMSEYSRLEKILHLFLKVIPSMGGVGSAKVVEAVRRQNPVFEIDSGGRIRKKGRGMAAPRAFNGEKGETPQHEAGKTHEPKQKRADGEQELKFSSRQKLHLITEPLKAAYQKRGEHGSCPRNLELTTRKGG